MDLSFEIPQLYNLIFHDALVAISAESTVKGVILDFFTNAAFQVSKILEFPTYYFFTSGASGLCPFLYLPTLRKRIPGNVNDLDIFLNIPGVPPIHASDMPVTLFDKHIINTAENMEWEKITE